MVTPTLEQYLVRRGYDLNRGTGRFLKRLFLESWQQAGFHRFWRVWNPLYGFFLYRLYLLLGGNRNRVVATLVVFASCGFFLHDLVSLLLFGVFSFVCTLGFFLYGVLSLASARLQVLLRQKRWPPLANAAVNVGLVVAGLWAGVRLNALLFG